MIGSQARSYIYNEKSINDNPEQKSSTKVQQIVFALLKCLSNTSRTVFEIYRYRNLLIVWINL